MENFKSASNDAVARARSRGSSDGGSTDKICPFMSDSQKEVVCTEVCKLHRAGKGNYNCYFMELQAISYALRPVR